ncbi:MAG: hypothetical protein ABJG14_00650, partial [Sulfitobacter sp.]
MMSERHSFSKTRLSVSKAVTGYTPSVSNYLMTDSAGWSRIECHNAVRRFAESDLGLSGRDLAKYCAQNDRRFDDIAQCLANLSRGSETLALSASEIELVL